MRTTLIKDKLGNAVIDTAWNDLLDEWGVETLMFKQEITSTLFLCIKLKDMATHEPPHIGHLIQEELARQGRTVIWLAKQLHCSRQNVYGIFENHWIYTDTLLKISEILDVDFFKVYCNYLRKEKSASNEGWFCQINLDRLVKDSLTVYLVDYHGFKIILGNFFKQKERR